jgi:glycosyltransferase involved in cell wall biosynthesis
MRILLLANYHPDRQESMLRFSGVLAAELPKHGVEVEVLSPSQVFGGRESGSESARKWLGYCDKYLLFPWLLRRRLLRLPAGTLVHICDHSNAVYVRFLGKTPHLLTCNDLLAIRAARGEFPGIRIGRSGRILQSQILKGINRAAYATCISEATRGDVLRLTSLPPERVTVTHMGQNYPYARLDEAAARNTVAAMLPEQHAPGVLSGRTRFVFHIGGNQWYKNRLGVLAIYEQMHIEADGRAEVPLLILAGQPLTAEIATRIEQSRIMRNSVVPLAGVGNRHLEALYSAAECLLFPSLAEGFGWPIVEAQACGCRVVTTRLAPMTEVGGDGPLYLDPSEVSGEAAGATRAARKILSLLAEPDAARQQRLTLGTANTARFTTAGMIEKYVRLYERITAAGGGL